MFRSSQSSSYSKANNGVNKLSKTRPSLDASFAMLNPPNGQHPSLAFSPAAKTPDSGNTTSTSTTPTVSHSALPSLPSIKSIRSRWNFGGKKRSISVSPHIFPVSSEGSGEEVLDIKDATDTDNEQLGDISLDPSSLRPPMPIPASPASLPRMHSQPNLYTATPSSRKRKSFDFAGLGRSSKPPSSASRLPRSFTPGGTAIPKLTEEDETMAMGGGAWSAPMPATPILQPPKPAAKYLAPPTTTRMSIESSTGPESGNVTRVVDLSPPTSPREEDELEEEDTEHILPPELTSTMTDGNLHTLLHALEAHLNTRVSEEGSESPQPVPRDWTLRVKDRASPDASFTSVPIDPNAIDAVLESRLGPNFLADDDSAKSPVTDEGRASLDIPDIRMHSDPTLDIDRLDPNLAALLSPNDFGAATITSTPLKKQNRRRFSRQSVSAEDLTLTVTPTGRERMGRDLIGRDRSGSDVVLLGTGRRSPLPTSTAANGSPPSRNGSTRRTGRLGNLVIPDRLGPPSTPLPVSATRRSDQRSPLRRSTITIGTSSPTATSPRKRAISAEDAQEVQPTPTPDPTKRIPLFEKVRSPASSPALANSRPATRTSLDWRERERERMERPASSAAYTRRMRGDSPDRDRPPSRITTPLPPRALTSFSFNRPSATPRPTSAGSPGVRKRRSYSIDHPGDRTRLFASRRRVSGEDKDGERERDREPPRSAGIPTSKSYGWKDTKNLQQSEEDLRPTLSRASTLAEIAPTTRHYSKDSVSTMEERHPSTPSSASGPSRTLYAPSTTSSGGNLNGIGRNRTPSPTYLPTITVSSHTETVARLKERHELEKDALVSAMTEMKRENQKLSREKDEMAHYIAELEERLAKSEEMNRKMDGLRQAVMEVAGGMAGEPITRRSPHSRPGEGASPLRIATNLGSGRYGEEPQTARRDSTATFLSAGYPSQKALNRYSGSEASVLLPAMEPRETMLLNEQLPPGETSRSHSPTAPSFSFYNADDGSGSSGGSLRLRPEDELHLADLASMGPMTDAEDCESVF